MSIESSHQSLHAAGSHADLLHSLLRGVPDLLLRFDLEGRLLYASEEIANLYASVTAASAPGKTMFEISGSEQESQFWTDGITAALESNDLVEVELRRTQLAEIRYLKIRFVPEGSPPEAVLCLVRDDTPHKAIEENYRTLFREMLEGCAVHQIVCDSEGNPVDYIFLAANPAFERMTGLKAEEIVGRNVLEVLPGTEQSWIDLYGDVALTGKPTNFEQYAGALKKHFRVTAFQPKPQQFATVFSDVTERVRTQQELVEVNKRLRKAVERAESANEAKSRFLANMSHEIRTPMNAILGFAQVLARDPHLTDSQAEHVRTITRSGNHLLNLINDVLDMSKIEAGKEQLHVSAFNLRGLLGDIQAVFRSRAEGKGLQLLFEVQDSVPTWAHGDQGKLRQILVNLLGNAVKYTETGGVAARVRATENSLLEVEVEDTGPGIEADAQEQLFEMFQQSDAGISKGGTGLGLPITRTYVQMMGGELSVTSEPDTGTCFRFHIVLEKAEEPEAEHDAPQKYPIGLAPDTPEHRILVVDDNRENRELLVHLLEPLGFLVQEAENGREALKLFKQWKPTAVLMDMRMPVMDGYDAVRALRRSAHGYSVFLVAVTASAFVDDEEEVLLTGADAYLRKPFRPDELLDILADGLSLRYLYDDASDSNGTSIAGRASAHTARLRPHALKVLDDGTRSELISALEEGDIERMEQLVHRVSEKHDELARTLLSLVDNYEFDMVLEALNAE